MSTRVNILTQHEPFASSKAACTHEIDILTLMMGNQRIRNGLEKTDSFNSCPLPVVRYELELNPQQDQV